MIFTAPRFSAAARLLRSAGLFAAALIAACSTEHGQREVENQGIKQGIETQPVEGPVTITPQAVPENPVPPAVVPQNFPHSITESDAGVAVLALWKQAQTARSANHLDQAESYLTRAIRIDPRNPWVWQDLAEVHLAGRQLDQAENEAQKSTSYGRGNPYLEAGNLQVIAGVRDARGDAAGALQARAQADNLLQSVPR
jgi:hypothetical protein